MHNCAPEESPKLFRNSRAATCTTEDRTAALFNHGSRTISSLSATFPSLELGPSDRWRSQTNKVEQVVCSRHDRACVSSVDFNRWPALSKKARRRADNIPVCKGSIDFHLPRHALAWNWRQTESRVISTSTRRAPVLGRSTLRECIRRHWTPALQPTAKLMSKAGYARPPGFHLILGDFRLRSAGQPRQRSPSSSTASFIAQRTARRSKVPHGHPQPAKIASP